MSNIDAGSRKTPEDYLKTVSFTGLVPHEEFGDILNWKYKYRTANGRIVQKTINWRKAIFVWWCTLPPDARKIQSQGKLAEVLEVGGPTLSKWKREPWFRAVILDYVIVHLLQDLIPVYRSIVDNAMRGSQKSQALFLSMFDIIKNIESAYQHQDEQEKLPTDSISDQAIRELNETLKAIDFNGNAGNNNQFAATDN
jgi:hypothetical protein